MEQEIEQKRKASPDDERKVELRRHLEIWTAKVYRVLETWYMGSRNAMPIDWFKDGWCQLYPNDSLADSMPTRGVAASLQPRFCKEVVVFDSQRVTATPDMVKWPNLKLGSKLGRSRTKQRT